MDPWARIDLYCERTDWGFWAEPLNACSNLAFFLVAAFIVVRIRRAQGRLPWDARVLVVLAVLVGTGSFLFHTFATVWGRWLDLAFIALFIYFFLARFLGRVAGLGRVGIFGGLIVYWGLERGALAAFPPGALAGSITYVPALVSLGGLAAFARWRGSPGAGTLALAVGAFVVALVFRTIDQTACPAWPAGTHFIWHCLIAWTLYLVGTSLFATRRGSAGSGLGQRPEAEPAQ